MIVETDVDVENAEGGIVCTEEDVEVVEVVAVDDLDSVTIPPPRLVMLFELRKWKIETDFVPQSS